MVDVESLPPPSSGPDELYFRRFLSRCYERIEKSDETWKRDPVFHRVMQLMALQDSDA